MKKHTNRGIRKVLLTLISTILVASLAFLLVACGGNGSANNPAADKPTEQTGGETVILKIGASPAPHAEILASVTDDLKAQGIDLQVVEYTDYVKPNLDTADGITGANYFQHQPYLTDFNAENGTDLVSVAAIHFEPLGIYPGKTKSLEALADGATIAVPNDTTNEARALHLLAAQGLITLPANADLTITPRDIVENPKNLQFVELEAAAIPVQLADIDLGVINGNYALGANLDPATVLVTEDVNSQAAQQYANIIVVKKGDENKPEVQALVKALTSDKVRKFINDTYKGVVVPVF